MLSISRQCQLLDPLTTTHQSPLVISEEELKLMKLIDQCYLELPFYGTRRVKDWQYDNHGLVMFGKDYLELIGLPENADGKLLVRKGISDAPRGINGLVFKSVTRNRRSGVRAWQSVGMAGDLPNSFS